MGNIPRVLFVNRKKEGMKMRFDEFFAILTEGVKKCKKHGIFKSKTGVCKMCRAEERLARMQGKVKIGDVITFISKEEYKKLDKNRFDPNDLSKYCDSVSRVRETFKDDRMFSIEDNPSLRFPFEMIKSLN